MKHKPDVWQIVLPATLKMDERLFVKNLGGKTRKPTIEIVDQNDLDILASKHASLTDYFEMGVLEKNASTKNQAAALSMNMDELVAHFEALDHHLESIDPDWRAELTRRDGKIIQVLRAKHPFAHEVSPINITFNAVFGSEHAALQKTFDQAMRFGTNKQIDLPPAVVSKFKVTGPAFIAHESESVGVSLIPLDYTGPTYPLELRFIEDDSSVASSHTGATQRIARAAGGANLEANFHGAVTVEFLLPSEPTASGGMNIGLDFTNADPRTVIDSTDLITDLQSGRSVEMWLDGSRLCTIQFSTPPSNVFAQDNGEIATFRSIAEDLEVVQRHTRQRFPIPNEVSGLDRANLRFFRLLAEGNCVVLPNMHNLTFTLNGKADDGLLSMLRGGPVQIFSTRDEFSWRVFGRQLRLGAYNMIAPQVEAVDAEEAVAALESGRGEGRELTMHALRGLGFWFMLQEHWPTQGDTQIRPVSWDLDGIDDPPDVAMYAEGAEHQVST